MKKYFSFCLGLIIVIYCLFPFIWTIFTAFKPPQEVLSLPVKYFPSRFSLENFVEVFYKRPFLYYILNSLIVGIGGTILTLLLSSIIAFRLRYIPITKALSFQRWLLIGAIIPPTLLVIPIFMFIRSLHLINNPLGLILSYGMLNLPFGVWMLYATFNKVPKELDEAALIDGYSHLEILVKIILPLSKAGLTVTAALVFIFCWNEFLIALTLMPDEKHYTVPVGIAMLSGTSVYEIPWGEINAAVTLTTVPVILVIALLQKGIVQGLTLGGLKK